METRREFCCQEGLCRGAVTDVAKTNLPCHSFNKDCCRLLQMKTTLLLGNNSNLDGRSKRSLWQKMEQILVKWWLSRLSRQEKSRVLVQNIIQSSHMTMTFPWIWPINCSSVVYLKTVNIKDAKVRIIKEAEELVCSKRKLISRFQKIS